MKRQGGTAWQSAICDGLVAISPVQHCLHQPNYVERVSSSFQLHAMIGAAGGCVPKGPGSKPHVSHQVDRERQQLSVQSMQVQLSGPCGDVWRPFCLQVAGQTLVNRRTSPNTGTASVPPRLWVAKVLRSRVVAMHSLPPPLAALPIPPADSE